LLAGGNISQKCARGMNIGIALEGIKNYFWKGRSIKVFRLKDKPLQISISTKLSANKFSFEEGKFFQILLSPSKRMEC
jgi:hypothetical protein